MKIIKDKILLKDLEKMAGKMFGDLIKAAVDIEKEIMVVDGELHADEEALLLKSGSKQENIWGINIYPKIDGENWIEFDSMINLRPSLNNYTRSIDNLIIKKRIIEIVNKLVKK